MVSILGSQASNCTPVAPSQLLSLGHNPGLGGTILVWGGTSSDLGGARPRNAPVVALVLLPLIWQFFFEVSDPKLRSGDRSLKNYCLTLLSIPISRSNFIFYF